MTAVSAAPVSPVRRLLWPLLFLGIALLLPACDLLGNVQLGSLFATLWAYALICLGLNVVTGFTGQLHLGFAGNVAIGAYAYAIATVEVYPFGFGFWGGLGIATGLAALGGVLLALPTVSLRGDYLAIVTLGFGEIIRDMVLNLPAITKGSQGLNPLPAPSDGFGVVPAAGPADHTWLIGYYLLLAVLVLAVLVLTRLDHARLGRQWVAVREDELAAGAMGLRVTRAKLVACAVGAGLAGLGGALLAGLQRGVTNPQEYDFQLSVMVLCAVIVGGLGSIRGAVVGALLVFGLDRVVLSKLTEWLARDGAAASSPMMVPSNWKLLIFGVVLVVVMRLRPQGLVPSPRVADEIADQRQRAAQDRATDAGTPSTGGAQP